MHGPLSALEQTITWTVIFFFASPAAGAAYLTPVEIRALAIAFFIRPVPRLVEPLRHIYSRF
jgi:hypothetical protein